jgi:chemotaxis family two-component system response regulator Rcp1
MRERDDPMTTTASAGVGTERSTWRILVVDDNPGDIHLVRMCVERWRGIDIDVVENAVQAHQFLMRREPFEAARRPDLVLLDLRMPIFDGTMVLEAIRSSAACTGLCVIVFTSSRLVADQARCRRLGASGFINKPTDWPEWDETIRDILQRHLEGFQFEPAGR